MRLMFFRVCCCSASSFSLLPFPAGEAGFLHLLQRRELFLHHVVRRLDGLHLLAQARSLQHAALIDGFEHDWVGLVRPAQREQALRRFSMPERLCAGDR